MNSKKELQDTHRVMSPEEMKKVLGGKDGPMVDGSEETNAVWCHCKGNAGEGIEAKSCDDCHSLCDNGVQNCNYIA